MHMQVYDVTSYVNEHPGGDAILNNAGADSTKGFLGDQHPIERVREMIEEFYVGKLQRA
jgi:cytochrome b involved in lipid metabolism